MQKTELLIPRRKCLLGTAGVVAGAAASGLLRTVPAFAQSMPTIPPATVRLACNPYGNHAWVVLAGRKGFLKDVGITLDPPEPKVVLEQQSVPQLENSEIDVSTMYLGLVTEAIDKTPEHQAVLRPQLLGRQHDRCRAGFRASRPSMSSSPRA